VGRLVPFYDERLDEAVEADLEVAKLPDLLSLAQDAAAEELAQGACPSAIELDLLEQEQGRRNGDLVIQEVGCRVDEKALALVAGEHDETEHASSRRGEQQVHRPAEADPVKLHRQP
jgi:hypothetical protein